MTRPEDHTYVMRRVREDNASGKNRKFNLEVAEHIATKGQEARDHHAALEEDRQLEREQLAAVGPELDLSKVNVMTITKLRDQLRIFKFIVENESGVG
jgi:plasmid stability protein